MVQRKVSNKLIGIQSADPVKSEAKRSWLGNFRPPSPHHQDGKNKSDLKKKKMKKSRSIKRSDFESLKSPIFKREQVPQPGKPPPPPPSPPLDDAPASAAAAATPQKQSPVKGSDSSPNYMKSTSSFDARKERTQVSPRSSQTSIDSKSPKKTTNNSKHGSVSGHKLAKTLSRTSSLKLMRTLTKSPSFKPARKCSQVVLCENFEVQKATCSSTLKDSKFPKYLALSPGATESEGNSVVKVCPYTYCSLNGHHHAPFPPLKCFLSARRRMLKTQKGLKLGCLSPRRAKPSCGGMEEITEQIALDGKPAIQELDSNIQEDRMDFFVEIFVRDTEDVDETSGGSKQNGDDMDETNFAANIMPSVVGWSNETEAEHDDGQVVERFSDEEIDFEDNLDNTSQVISTKMEAAEEVYSPFSNQEEESPECLTNQSDFEAESPAASTELDETDSETSDMDWEEGQYSALSLDDEVRNSTQTNNEYEPILKSDDIDSSYLDEIAADECPEEFFEKDGASFEAGCSNSSSDSEDSYQNLGSDESMQEFNNQNYPVSHTNDVFKESTTEERDENAELDDFVATAITLSPVEEPIEEPSEAREDDSKVLEADNENLQLGDASNIKDKALIDHEEYQYTHDSEASAMLEIQECDSSHDLTEPHHDETHEYYSSSDNTEFYQSDAVREEAFVESLLPETLDPETNQSLEKEFSTADAGDGTKKEEEEEEEEQEGAAKSLTRILTFDMLQDLSEDDQDMNKEDKNEIQFGGTAEDGESNQFNVDEGPAAEIQVHSSVKESQSFKISDSLGSEDQTPSELNKVSVAENSNEDDHEMEVEHSTMSDSKESLLSSKKEASKQAKTAFFRGRNNSSQELPKTPNNLRISRCKRPVEESEEPSNFNPREPNYLPIEPNPEAEKVDLRHQMVDERKNSEEWMIDYALRQAVTKLAPARKRRVSLLVEAFEKVMPTPKYESHLKQHTSAAFTHVRPIQACS